MRLWKLVKRSLDSPVECDDRAHKKALLATAAKIPRRQVHPAGVFIGIRRWPLGHLMFFELCCRIAHYDSTYAPHAGPHREPPLTPRPYGTSPFDLRELPKVAPPPSRLRELRV